MLINKYIFTALTTAAALFSLPAQTTRDIMLADPVKCAGVYATYPETISASTPVPKGYKAFYVSHYGRHGSRYLINESDYTDITDAMAKADKENLLTPLGKEVLRRLSAAKNEAEGRAGELAPLGYRQHRAIADRLIDECPQAFDKTAEVEAMSTVLMRCAHSMFAFTGKLIQQNPELNISMESSRRNMPFMSYNNPAAQAFNSTTDAPWNLRLNEFKKEQTNPDRLMSALFVSPTDASRFMNPDDIMWKLYWVAIDLPNMECGETLFDIFTPQELFDLWQVFNYEFYTRNSCNPENGGVFLESAKNLLSNVIANADRYIAGNKHGATLRFGHDSTIIPFAGLLQIPVASGKESDPENLYLTYADYRVSPMASNFQMRLYRNKKGDILAKFLLNEQEIPLPDTPCDNFPYYKWSDARKTLQRILDTPVKL